MLGLLEGFYLELKCEVVMIGVYYDYVGYGMCFNSFGLIGCIYNGVDDNVSGMVGFLEIIEGFVDVEE